MDEIWKDVQGYEGLYQVSNFGRVKSFKTKIPKIIQGTINSKGYRVVGLFKLKKQRKFQIHQLVAVGFLSHKIKGYYKVVDHIDSNPLNNNLDNLQVISQRENCAKANRSKTSDYTGVCFYKPNGKWCSQIYIRGKMINLGYFETQEEAFLRYQKELLTIK